MNEQGVSMNTWVKGFLISMALSSVIYAQEIISEIQSNEMAVIVNSNDNSLHKRGALSTYEFGASKITLGNAYHKALHFETKALYKFDNNIALYLEGTSNYYKYAGDNYDMGISSLGISYDVPYTDNRFSLGAALGVGMNIDYTTLFSHFTKSFDFGLAYRLNVNYNFDHDWGMNIAYTKFDFNTNHAALENTKPEIVSVSLVYTFDSPLFKRL